MAMLSAALELEPDDRSLESSVDAMEEAFSPAETLQMEAEGLDTLSEEVESSTMLGLETAFEAADTLTGAALGGAAGSLLPGRLGPAGAAAGATRGASEGASGIGSSVSETLKATPITATLGAIAGGVTEIARNTGPLGSILNLFDTAVSIALLPINTTLARYLQPLATSAVSLAKEFSQNVQGDGLGIVLGKTGSFLLSQIKGGIDWVQSDLGPQIWAVLPSDIKRGLTWLQKNGTSYFNLIISSLGGIASFFGGLIENPIDTLDSTFDDAVTLLENNLPDFVTYFIGGQFKTDITEALSTIPFVGESSLPTGSLEGVTQDIGDGIENGDDLLDQIPQLASGGVVRGPTMAMVGESGSEAVVPLDRLDSMLGESREIKVETEVDLDDSEMVSLLRSIRDELRKLRDRDPVEIREDRFSAGRLGR